MTSDVFGMYLGGGSRDVIKDGEKRRYGEVGRTTKNLYDSNKVQFWKSDDNETGLSRKGLGEYPLKDSINFGVVDTNDIIFYGGSMDDRITRDIKNSYLRTVQQQKNK